MPGNRAWESQVTSTRHRPLRTLWLDGSSPCRVAFRSMEAETPGSGEPAVVEEGESNGRRHVVLLLHGIRTTAAWQERVRAGLEHEGNLEVLTVRYGVFDLVRFLAPELLGLRRQPVERMARELRAARTQYPNARLSVIAHSFGTWIMGEVLEDNPDIRLDRLVLCGSVLERGYRWDKLSAQLAHTVSNDVGTRDPWPLVAEKLGWGYGATGLTGFGAVGVRDRFHRFGHSEFLTTEFARTYWRPWLVDGDWTASAWDVERPAAPWWFSAIAAAPIKLLAVALLALALLVGVRETFLEAGARPDTRPDTRGGFELPPEKPAAERTITGVVTAPAGVDRSTLTVEINYGQLVERVGDDGRFVIELDAGMESSVTVRVLDADGNALYDNFHSTRHDGWELVLR